MDNEGDGNIVIRKLGNNLNALKIECQAEAWQAMRRARQKAVVKSGSPAQTVIAFIKSKAGHNDSIKLIVPQLLGPVFFGLFYAEWARFQDFFFRPKHGNDLFGG